MSTIEILQEVFSDVFDDQDIVLYPEMTAGDYDDWDSLAHIQLVVAAEKAFDLKFTTGDILKLHNVGEFVELIDNKLGLC